MTLPALELETAPNPSRSVIWLHGLGADGNDFAPIVPQLVDRGWPALRFVFPHAPVRPVTINNGMPMRAWYDIAAFDLNARQDEAGMRASVDEMESLIARENQRGVPSERIVLAGFSQGGAIALAAGLQHPEKLAGIIALSTYLPAYVAQPGARSAANAGIPIFWGHGSLDPVVALQRGLESRDVLQSLGYAVQWHTYPMAHAVCPEEISDLRHWLGQRLGML
jgi:phospholipase/carboxylesterase